MSGFSTFSNGYTGYPINFYLDSFKTPLDGSSNKIDKDITTRLINMKDSKVLLVSPITESISLGANINWETGPSSILDSLISGFGEGANTLRSMVGDFGEVAGFIKGLLTGDSSIPGMNNIIADLNKSYINPYDARRKFAGTVIQPPQLMIESYIIDDGTDEDYVTEILDNLTKHFLGDLEIIESNSSKSATTFAGYELAPNGFNYLIDGKDAFESKLPGGFTLEIGQYIKISNLLVESYNIQLQTVNAYNDRPLSAKVTVGLTPGKKFYKSDISGWYGGTIGFDKIRIDTKVASTTAS